MFPFSNSTRFAVAWNLSHVTNLKSKKGILKIHRKTFRHKTDVITINKTLPFYKISSSFRLFLRDLSAFYILRNLTRRYFAYGKKKIRKYANINAAWRKRQAFNPRRGSRVSQYWYNLYRAAPQTGQTSKLPSFRQVHSLQEKRLRRPARPLLCRPPRKKRKDAKKL